MTSLTENSPYGQARADRSALARLTMTALAVGLVITSFASLFVGATGLTPLDLMSDILDGREIDLQTRVVILDIRLPRLILGILVGASLAVSGVVMQGLFRNPLADPGLVGVSAGAGLGAIVAIVLGGLLPPALGAALGYSLMPIAAFLGGWLSVIALYSVATRGGHTSVATMLLAGIALGALVGALSGILVYKADDTQLRDLTFWGMGSLGAATWSKIVVSFPLMAAAIFGAPFLAKGLNGLALGEATARHMGTNVQRMKNIAILLVAAAVGAAVAVSGGIGFVGIVVPHLLRLAVGPDHRFLLPNAALLGAIILLLADMIARVIVAPAELPIGIVMAVIGGPFFLWILMRRRGVLEM